MSTNEDNPQTHLQDQDSEMPQQHPALNQQQEPNQETVSVHHHQHEDQPIIIIDDEDDYSPHSGDKRKRQSSQDDDNLEDKILKDPRVIERCYDKSDNGDITLLKTLIRNQSDNYLHTPQLYQFIKNLSMKSTVEPSSEDFEMKLRLKALKTKFRLIESHKGLNHEFEDQKSKDLFELSKKIWGPKTSEDHHQEPQDHQNTPPLGSLQGDKGKEIIIIDDDETEDVLDQGNPTVIESCYDNNDLRDVKILKTMIDHQSSSTDFANIPQLNEFIKNRSATSTTVEASSDADLEIKLRVRALEAKFQLIATEKGLSYEFDDHKSKELFELSKKIWGPKSE